MDAFPNHDTVWLQEWRQSVSFPFPRLSCPTIWVKWRFLQGHPGKKRINCRRWLQKWGRCLLPNTQLKHWRHEYFAIGLERCIITSPLLDQCIGWQQLKTMEIPMVEKKTLKWLGSYHSINMASLVSESWFCKLLCSIFILGHLKKHGLTLDNFV